MGKQQLSSSIFDAELPLPTDGLPQKLYLATLDGWRAIAIVAVLLCHMAEGWFALGSTELSILVHLNFGVEIFFAISGLLICSLLLREKDKAGRISFRNFYLRRAFRIVPVYLVYLFVLGVLDWLGQVAIGKQYWLGCLLFCRNYLSNSPPDAWYTAHFWSLAVEEHFYLIAPVLLACFSTKTNRYLIPSLALIISVWRMVDFRMQIGHKLFPQAGLYMRSDTRLDCLLWGCWCAVLISDSSCRSKLTSLLNRNFRLIALAGVLWCLLKPPPMAFLWLGILAALLVTSTVLNPATSFSRLLEHWLLRKIGKLSYSIYVWQMLFLGPTDVAHTVFMHSIRSMPISLFILIVISIASFYWIETPLRLLGLRLISAFSQLHSCGDAAVAD
jgi:peptidoglycan/LPS O-acetylase OafA/YrhL